MAGVDDEEDPEPGEDIDADRWAYERAMLRYMLELKTPDGRQAVCAETLLREFLDEISVRHIGPTTTMTADLVRWARGESEDCTDDPHCLCHMIWQSYRVMVGAFQYRAAPDWLCAPPSPTLGSADFPAWDRFGRRVV